MKKNKIYKNPLENFLFNNLILKSDSYKISHYKQYPEGTTKIYSYLESRGGKFDKTLFFGLQYYLKKYFEGNVISVDFVKAANEFSKEHFGTDIFNYEGWMYIATELGGKLPLKIMAAPEGFVIPVSNVLLTIENTDDKCFWLTNWAETLIMKLWATITVSTNSWYSKQLIKKHMENTGSESSGLPFKLHDFGYRGVSSEESAGLLCMSHLVNFMGTDTLEGIIVANEYYNPTDEFKMYGYSIPASEHSTMTSWGKDNEMDAVLNMIKQYPTGLVSCVGDSYNIYNFAQKLSEEPFKSKILGRDGTFVLRPDSGDLLEVISKLLDILWNGFGGIYNDKGFKVLDPHIRIIQGDGIDFDSIGEILKMIEAKKFSIDNIVFGSGGGLLQKFDRDTQKFAIKCSHAIINGVEVDVQKDPVTSSGKKSKKGKLKLHSSMGNFMTLSSNNLPSPQYNSYVDTLIPVFENGVILKEYSFEEVRENSEKFKI
jgi:nicotinamide phosphoribosyltransferase